MFIFQNEKLVDETIKEVPEYDCGEIRDLQPTSDFAQGIFIGSFMTLVIGLIVLAVVL